jgi:hypothetical protein
LFLLLVALFAAVGVFAASLLWVDNPVLKVLICVGTGLTSIVLVTQVAVTSAAIGRSRRER